MDLASVYGRIEERLEKIDFPALFRDFCRFPFAVYDETRAYMEGAYFDRPAEFMANTSVKYNGRDTAIWLLTEEPGDYDTLTSKIVHEMLHAFQNASGETRWADERGALVKYRNDPANVSARLEEAACMKACLTGDSPEAFRRLLSLRKARQERFAFEYDYEARIEQIEGTANYVELSVLAQLNPGLAEKRWEGLLEKLADPARYFPARAVTYMTGAAMIACLRRYTDMDTDGFTDTPFAEAALADAVPCPLPEADPGAEACLAEWRKGLRETAERTMAKGKPVLEGEYRMIAWNVYDGCWDGQYAVLTAFVGYIDGTQLPETDQELFAMMKVIQGNFVAEVDENLRITRLWEQ